MEDETLKKPFTGNFIDLEQVIYKKNPKLLKVLPRFVIAYLKRIIHQDDVNSIIRNNQNKYGLDFLNACIEQFGVKVMYSGIENINPEGRWIIAANHPLGGLDGMALMSVVGKVNSNILVPANDLLLNVENLRMLFIPVNKHGSNAGNVKIIDETFASDKAMFFFPAGLCSRKQQGKICDLEWKKSFITKARIHKRDIIPCYISGRNSDWFYNLARLRAWLGIKSNIEMLYLVDEMFRQRDKEITITFGKPISYTIFDKSYTDLMWAQKVKKLVYSLNNDKNSRFTIQ